VVEFLESDPFANLGRTVVEYSIACLEASQKRNHLLVDKLHVAQLQFDGLMSSFQGNEGSLQFDQFAAHHATADAENRASAFGYFLHFPHRMF
jgi:hypothetical protein